MEEVIAKWVGATEVGCFVSGGVIGSCIIDDGNELGKQPIDGATAWGGYVVRQGKRRARLDLVLLYKTRKSTMPLALLSHSYGAGNGSPNRKKSSIGRDSQTASSSMRISFFAQPAKPLYSVCREVEGKIPK